MTMDDDRVEELPEEYRAAVKSTEADIDRLRLAAQNMASGDESDGAEE